MAVQPGVWADHQAIQRLVRQRAQGPDQRPEPKGKYGFAGLQSKTKNIFPQLLHIHDITHINDFLEWAGQKEAIVIFDEHCVIDFENLPLPVQVVEIQWRDRYARPRR